MRENLRRPLVTPTLRGIHHLALCTDDMKATIDFYVDVLGMPLVHAMKVPPGSAFVDSLDDGNQFRSSGGSTSGGWRSSFCFRFVDSLFTAR